MICLKINFFNRFDKHLHIYIYMYISLVQYANVLALQAFEFEKKKPFFGSLYKYCCEK